MSRTSTVLLRTQSDDRLVALARSGQERAFETIVRRYRRPLLAACRRMIDDGRAEDVLQQSLMAAWGALRRGDEVRDLRPWLFRIVRNAAVSHRRRAGHPAAELLETLGVADGPQEEAERREVIREALETIAGLPPRQRDALLRIAVQGRSQDEVADELGVSRIAVRQLVHRARTSLRAAATALAPLPLMSWAAGTAASEPLSLRIASLITGAGGMGALAKAGAVAGVAATAVAGPSLVQHRPAESVAPQVATAPPARSPAATRPTPAAPDPELVAARVARPPAATPTPRPSGRAKPVRTTDRRSATTTSRSHRGAGDDVRTGRSGDREDGEVTTRRRAEEDDGERDARDVSRAGDSEDGHVKRSTDSPRTRDEAASGGGEDDDGDAEERSSGAAEDDGEAATEAKQEPVSKALAVTEPDEGSDDEAETAQSAPDTHD
jgi:RNA polymerase sigma factor (sigma-70 family)